MIIFGRSASSSCCTKLVLIISLSKGAKLENFSLKSSKDLANLQLDKFLNGLSNHEIKQFKSSGDYSNIVESIKSMNIEDEYLNNFQDIKNLDDQTTCIIISHKDKVDKVCDEIIKID